MLLFIIPGIVKSYEYMMIPYLLAEHPEMTRQEAFAESKQMMDGNKWDAFVLDLSFIGWTLLGVCTFGILLVFYVEPYIYLTRAELYHAKRVIKSPQVAFLISKECVCGGFLCPMRKWKIC